MQNSKGILFSLCFLVLCVAAWVDFGHADGVTQPAHVYGTYATNDCAKINATGFVVTNGAACSGAGTAQVFSFGGGFVNGGSTITTAISIPVTVPSTCTVRAWAISIPATDTGTATVKFLRLAAGTASPGSANSINTSGVSLSSGTHIRSTTLSDFTSTAITAGDIIAVNLTTVGGTPTGLTANLECQ